MKRPNIHRWLLALLFASAALTACVKEFYPEDDVLQENPVDDEHPFGDGPVLNFLATIDVLGDNDPLNPMEEIENYIDPEKFRILFFTDDSYAVAPNTFLFESKTRFIKKLPQANGINSEWRVSVPLFNYGNAVNNGWNWDDIRVYLRDNKFKIAVLANRPENEWSMRIVGKTTSAKSSSKDPGHDYDYSDNNNDVIVPGAWYDNSYPHWVAENSLFKRAEGAPAGSPEDTEIKTLFDLHHCQYDPIYDGKNWNVAGMINGVSNPENWGAVEADNFDKTGDEFNHENLHVYDFVSKFTDDSYTADAAGPKLKDGRRPKMGSTSSWVSWAGFDGALGDEKLWNNSPFPSDGWILKDWTDLINTIYGTNNEGYQGTFSETNQGLTITKTSTDGKIKAPNKDCIDNNDGSANSGDERVCFSFRLPKLTNGGEWKISVKVSAATTTGNPTNYHELFLKVGGAVYDRKTFTSTSATEYTFKTVSPEEDNTLVEVYAMGRTSFYSIKCVAAGSMDLSQYNNKDHWNWGFRRSIHPKKSYPIPMYGIQRFEKIGTDWDWETNYTLTDPIYLLRSVVRIDLIVPKTLDVTFLTFHYPNIFARCEPMDVWTPTDELWDNYIETGKELDEIRNYGPIARSTDTKQGSAIRDYQKRMSWIYGIWADQNVVGSGAWKWNSDLLDASGFPDEDAKDVNMENGNKYHPHIFNPCVQRNGQIYCEISDQYPDCIKKEYDGLNDVYVIYTGERNINDPSNFTRLGNSAGGGPTIAYFLLGVGTDAYTIPLADYSNTNVSSRTDLVVKNTGIGPKGSKPTNKISNSYEQAVMAEGTGNKNIRPYPLIRNHRYIFRITGVATRAGETQFSVTSEVRHSKFVRPEVAPKLEK